MDRSSLSLNHLFSKQPVEPGLYVIATPIGNLSDISFRALQILDEVDLIAAEDTRHTGVLLSRFGVRSKVISYHEHNARRVLPVIMERLQDGLSVALVSDAGTPAISDPGYRVIRAAIESDIRVIPVPGASSILAALVASGLPTDRFTFEGFLPRKKGRRTRLSELAVENRTMLFFESPHRIVRTLDDLKSYFGSERPVAVCRN